MSKICITSPRIELRLYPAVRDVIREAELGGILYGIPHGYFPSDRLNNVN